jgi:hypothetical protein
MTVQRIFTAGATFILLCFSMAVSTAAHAQYNSAFASTLRQIEQSRKELANIPSADYGRIKLNLPNQPAGQQQQQPAEPPSLTWTERYLQEQAMAARIRAWETALAEEAARWEAWSDKQFNSYALPQLKRYPADQRGTAANLAYAVRVLEPLRAPMKAMADSITEPDLAEYGALKLAAYVAHDLARLDNQNRTLAQPLYVPVMALDIARRTNYMPFRTVACMWGGLRSNNPWDYRFQPNEPGRNYDKAVYSLWQEITQQCQALLDEPARALLPQLRTALAQTQDRLPSRGLNRGCYEKPELVMATREFWQGTNDGKDHAAVLNKVNNIHTQLRNFAAGCAPDYPFVYTARR